MSIPALAEDIVLLALHPTETRDLHNHHGLRDTIRTSELFDQVLAGGPVPTAQSISRTLRFSGRKSLDPWLDQLAAQGKIELIGKRRGLLSWPKFSVRDHAGRHAAQERLYAGFNPGADARSAALVMLVGIGNLMRWAARPGDNLQALLDAGTRVNVGQTAPVGLDPQILGHFARVLEKSIFLESD